MGQDENSVNAPVAEGQGDTAQPAPAQGVNVQPTTGQGDTAQPAPGKANTTSANTVQEPDTKGPIPYERFEEINRKNRTLESQAQEMQARLSQQEMFLRQLVQNQQQGSQQAAQQPQDWLADFTDSDLLDPVKVRAAIKKAHETALSEANKRIEQVQFQAQYGDYTTLVGTQNPLTNQWVPSATMTEALNERPQLAQALQSGDRRAMAYEIAVLQKKLGEARAAGKQNQTPPTQQVPPVQTVTQQIRAAQQTPLSIGAATGTGQVDRMNETAKMSDQEFRARLARAQAGRGQFWDPLPSG